MLINDTITCNNCNCDIEWYYQIPQKPTLRMLPADKLPKDKEKVSSCEHIEDNQYELTCTCPECHAENIFTYFSDYKLHIN